MVGSVKSRRNHYETLGLEPSVTDEDIAAAFAVESRKIIQNPRVNEPDVREKARQVRTAHQTLRDPAKRSAYDASLGLVIVPPVYSPEAPGEGRVRPFVAAAPENAAERKAGDFESLRRTETPPAAFVDEHVEQGPIDAVGGRQTRRARGPRPQADRRSKSTTDHRQGVFVAPMPRKSPDEPARQFTDDRLSQNPPEQAPAAREPQAPLVAPPPGVQEDAADAAPAHSPQAEPQPDSAAQPEPGYLDDRSRFEDTGVGTAARYGERPRSKFNRTAAAAVGAPVAALAVLALWMWPSGNRVDPLSNTGSTMASADGLPPLPNALGEAPSEDAAAETESPFELPELADAGSYESLTFSDAGPIPAIGSSPVNEAPAAPAANGAADAPAGASNPGADTALATAPAPAGTIAPGAQPAPGASAQGVASAPARTQPAPDLRPVTPAKLVRGSLLNSDNRRGAFQGTVSVRFTVGVSGRATGCSPTSGSGDARLDAYTCELVEQRLQFSPALTSQGQPVASEIGATYTWGRKRRTLTGRVLDLIR